jgi:hypothetical protein
MIANNVYLNRKNQVEDNCVHSLGCWREVPFDDAGQASSITMASLTAWRSFCLHPRYRSVVCTDA